MATYPEYTAAALRHAHYEQMEDNGWFASIPGFDGLWAEGDSVEEARQQLIEALDGWITVHSQAGKNQLPVIDGIHPYEAPKRLQHP
jgi:predicted RNase H-like HicB family nuclease